MSEKKIEHVPKIILAIETSCDETAASIVKDGKVVLSSIVLSQIEKHIEFGGVIPEIAARFHLQAIDQVVRKALADANLDIQSVDAIAVTRGPGLVGALLIGISYAKTLALSLNKPLFPVNHVHAHIHGALLSDSRIDSFSENPLFPSVALVVSGGHTNLYQMHAPDKYKLLGSSLDDACGECFDKVAKLLKFDYPGGPKIEQHAKRYLSHDTKIEIAMPKIMQNASYDFSYSGLKTHMNLLIQAHPEWVEDEEHLAALCFSFQQAAFEQIYTRIRRALNEFPETKSVIIAGGVSANLFLRERLLSLKTKLKSDVNFLFPELKYCSDNAAMIAACAFAENFEYLYSSPSLYFDSNASIWDAESSYFKLI